MDVALDASNTKKDGEESEESEKFEESEAPDSDLSVKGAMPRR